MSSIGTGVSVIRYDYEYIFTTEWGKYVYFFLQIIPVDRNF